ncbi:MAG TPA: glycosyltransferase family 2 protein [Actinomycetales bacterium]|nr:glycosyltransferase family 2 protein [Actinomycetales bacterium]
MSVAASLVAWPLLFVVLDTSAQMVSRLREVVLEYRTDCSDFQVLVPIYGSVAYLENVPFLAGYGSRVTLCTTSSESETFRTQLQALCHTYGFTVFEGDVGRRSVTSTKRATSGTVRDRVIHDALPHVTAEYVVCLDADTASVLPLGRLVGRMQEQDLDLASVRLVPTNDEGPLGKLQRHEYRTAMMLRRIMPWMVSGACHVARTAALRDIMARHSLFFQGNDVEVGILGERLGYRVGHVPFDVQTTVPVSWRAWFRQRVAWAGGEVRLFLVNPQLVLRHPVLWLYGGGVSLLCAPFRWVSVVGGGWVLAVVLGANVAIELRLHRRHRDRWLLVLPFYLAFASLVLTPLGLWSYVVMAVRHRNAGLIRVGRRRGSVGVPGRRRLASEAMCEPAAARHPNGA